MSSNCQYAPPCEKFIRTDEFRERAIFFENNGFYTKYLKGTDAYKTFWEDEHYKCQHGMTNSAGITITGIHYFYLNYIQIKAEDKATNRKKFKFPRFLDIDYDYFHIVDAARRLKKGLIFSKPRRTGFSYKNAAIVTHEYNFHRASYCVIGAFLEKLSTTTMNMVRDNMDFLNANTEWRKQRNPDTKDHCKAQFEKKVDGVKVMAGYKSEVKKLTFKDNPFAAVGLTTSVFIFEEAGTLVNLRASYGITEPCWKDGDNMIGLPIIFGTGGDMEGGTADFAYMFNNPRSYNLLEFNNIWESGKEGTTCGWFIPATRGRLGEYNDPMGKHPEFKNLPMVDEDGNSNEDLALLSIEELREIKRIGGDPKNIQDAITQYPLTPSESFLRSSGAIFSSIEMHEWLSRLETTPSLRDNKKKIELYFDDNGIVKDKLNPDLIEIEEYPLPRDRSKKGCIVIWEDPIPNAPFGLYIAGCDPYDQDKAESTDSLGSFFIYKRFMHNASSYDIPVAEYTGRPERADEFYENCRRLCIYYNAKCLYENQLKGLKAYFEMKHSLHYLCEQPQIIKDIVKDSKVSRGYGIHMNRNDTNSGNGIKDQCEIYLRQWLYESRSDSEGNKIMNLHTIKSIALLKELIAYDRVANTDRVIAFMLCILQSKELHKLHLESSMPQTLLDIDPFFRKTLYKKNTNNKIIH
jgi:hypothetical protein